MRFAALMIPFLLVASVASARPRERHRTDEDDASAAKVARIDDDATDDDDDDDDDEIDHVAIRRAKRARAAARATPATELYFRAGVAFVRPGITSSGMTLEPVGLARLATPMGPVQGGVESSPSTVATAILGIAPGALRGYVALETIIGIPQKTQLKAYGDLATMSLAPTALDLIPTGVPPLGTELGEASAVPLMLTALFRPPALGPLRAYVGGGASVLFVTGAKITNPVLTEVATPKLEISPSLGVVAQAGIDLHLFGSIYARVDYKMMWFEPAETRISNIHVRTDIPLLETVHVGSARSTATANPRIIQIGIGANF